jgi:hypothetical protein
VGQPVGGAFMTPGADLTFDVGFHQHLQHRLRDAAQEVVVSGLLEQVCQCHTPPCQ